MLCIYSLYVLKFCIYTLDCIKWLDPEMSHIEYIQLSQSWINLFCAKTLKGEYIQLSQNWINLFCSRTLKCHKIEYIQLSQNWIYFFGLNKSFWFQDPESWIYLAATNLNKSFATCIYLICFGVAGVPLAKKKKLYYLYTKIELSSMFIDVFSIEVI